MTSRLLYSVPCHQAEIQVLTKLHARRARSKVIYMINRVHQAAQNHRLQYVRASESRSRGTSGGTSEISSGRINRRRGGSTHIRPSAEAIIRLLSRGEVRIRQLLGDSPDTSKALRMFQVIFYLFAFLLGCWLLRMDVVKRSGNGGRTDPFIYSVHGDTMVAAIG